MKLPAYVSTEFPIGQSEDLQMDKRFPTNALEELYIDAQTLGNLIVYFDAEDQARVLAVAEEHLLPERVELEGKRLVIEAKNFRRFLEKGQSEKIRIEVHVPAKTRVNAHFGAGVLYLAGGEGDVEIVGGVGEISGYSNARKFNVKLRGGDISLSNIAGEAALKINVGSISLNWSDLSGDENVEAKCDLGSIDLHLPPAVVVVEDQGGWKLRKTVDIPFSTHINAEVGFGGLDVLATDTVQVTA